jgi:putative hydrolase of the HAD superfamily
MKNKIYMFDADGVVVQSQMFSYKYAQEFDIDISELDDFFKTDFQECLVGKSDLRIVIKPWLDKWNWSKSVDEFLNYWFNAEHNINFDLIESIKKLREKKIKCVLATNQEQYRLEYMKKEMDFETTFDKIYSSNLIGFTKPATQYYEYILNDLNVTPSNVIFYDDRQENVESAKSLGINSISYCRDLKLA